MQLANAVYLNGAFSLCYSAGTFRRLWQYARLRVRRSATIEWRGGRIYRYSAAVFRVLPDRSAASGFGCREQHLVNEGKQMVW